MTLPTGLLRLLLLAVALLLSPLSHARAGWNASPEVLRGMPTWLYQPAAAMPNGRHALLIVLHGCKQDHSALKQYGNLDLSAETSGAVVALPSVGERAWLEQPDAHCWDYDGGFDRQGTIQDMVRLARQLSGRASLNIDPNHVYVAGLSAGATLALSAACRGPDVFAGVAAVAGPSVGSRQDFALFNQFAIPLTNVGSAVATCRALAGDKVGSLATQLASIAFGDMDADGSQERYPFFLLDRPQWLAHSGQLALVSVRWSRDNALALQLLYGIDHVDLPEWLPGGQVLQQMSWKGGLPRLSLLQISGLGHAWPAGATLAGPRAPALPGSSAASAGAAVPNDDTIFILQRGMNYASQVSKWLIANNLRALLAPGPQVSVRASAGSGGVLVKGQVRGDAVPTVRLVLQASSGRELARHPRVPVAADGSFADRFVLPEAGTVQLEVAAKGFRGSTVVLSDPVTASTN